MAAAAAALAAADPAPAVSQAAGSGGATSRRDFYWLRSFLAGGVLSTLRAVPQKEGYLGLYKGNGAMMIRIFPYGAIQFMAFEHYKTVVGFSLLSL
ncbi:hypothetical protein U0070_026123 [Myodes glareolus]|uniref:Uncharacterized protein n=1 Tax=Myodes glareolus TaxID=447135 RepID=A0AAW0HX36_MYOGA